jgi:hypothetical protein
MARTATASSPPLVEQTHSTVGGNDLMCRGSGTDTLFDGFGRDSLDVGTSLDNAYLCPDGAFDRLFMALDAPRRAYEMKRRNSGPLGRCV